MRTLLIGDINDIQGCLREKLGSNNQYNNAFTKNEQRIVENEDHKKWDITLLFKVIQKVCGLDPVGTSSWTQSAGDGNDPLEFLITTLKECRNRQVHQFGVVLNEHQLADNLDMLIDLALKITKALEVRAQELGKQISMAETDKIVNLVNEIVEDVKGKINESSPAVPSPIIGVSKPADVSIRCGDKYDLEKLESDSLHGLAEALEELSKKEALKKEVEKLEREFWYYAGTEEVES